METAGRLLGNSRLPTELRHNALIQGLASKDSFPKTEHKDQGSVMRP